MAPTEKSNIQFVQDKFSEASLTVTDLVLESFRLQVKGERIVTRIRGSVVPTIVAPVVFFALYASIFAALRTTGILPTLGSSVISLLSMAIGMLVSFRTSSAYERWWGCRGMWATISTTSRTMMMNLWMNFREDGSDVGAQAKETLMKLIIAYSVALKHYCREEPGLHHADLAPFLPQDFVQTFEGRTPHIAPLEIVKAIHQYVSELEREGRVDGRTAGSLYSGVNTLMDQISNAERILTPWPLAYSIHLKQIITIYCLALPPQLASNLGWWTVPVTSAAVFTFFGMEAIAIEISHPCGYDLNDLPVDKYCAQLKSEMSDMMAEKVYRPNLSKPIPMAKPAF